MDCACIGRPCEHDARNLPPDFRLRPAGSLPDRQEPDGSVWRVHVFHLVTEAGAILTDETPDGPLPVVLTSLPIRVALPKPVRPAPQILVPGNRILH